MEVAKTEIKEMIPVQASDDGEIKLSGRDLHEFLEIDTPYTQWFDRMCAYGFDENVDFMSFSQKSEKPQGGRPTTDHVITIDMAKELCMLQRNDKGKMARQYFIEVEKAYNSPEKIMARALKIADSKIQSLTTENQVQAQIIGELKPKADYTDMILKNDSLMSTTSISKDYGMSARTFNNLLHDIGVQYKQSGQWFLYSKYHDKGYTHSETFEFEKEDGSKHVRMTTKWTQKGRLFLYNTLKEAGVLERL